jgi:hypothetical protein
MESYQARKLAHSDEYHEKFRGKTDIHTLSNLYWELSDYIQVQKEFTKEKSTYTLIKNFSQENSINNKTLQQALIVLKDIEAFFEWERVETCDDLEEAGNLATEIFLKSYAKNRLEKKASKKGSVYIGENQVQYIIGSRVSFNRIKDAPVIVAAQLMEVVGKKGTYNIASIIANIE